MRPNNERTRFGLQEDTSVLSSMVTCSYGAGFGQDALAAIDSVATRSGLPWEKRHMHEIGSFAPGRIPAAVVANCRRHAFMTDHLLDTRQVGAGVRLSQKERCAASRVV
jgi:hypothetical protein